MDWIARTYITAANGRRYRIKVFDHIVTIERQPDGNNQLYPRQDTGDIYDGVGFSFSMAQAAMLKLKPTARTR